MGIFSDVCQRLAVKHSDAVDFPKTGVCPDLDKTERPLEYPDFMGKRDKTTRRSERVLGKMYRECQVIENVCTQVERKGTVEQVHPDCGLVVGEHVSYVKKARRSRDRYNDQLRSLMPQYGIETEAEAVSGCIVKLHKHMEDRHERYEIERVAKVRIEDLRKRTRQDFFEEFEGEESVGLDHPHVLGKASAWYTVTYSDPDTKLLSFPWVIGDILGILKTATTARTAFSECPVIDNITHQLANDYSSTAEFTIATLQAPNKFFVDKRGTLLPVVQMYVGRYANTLPLVAFLRKWMHEYLQIHVNSADLVFTMLSYAVKAGFMVDLGEAPAGVTKEWLSLTCENVSVKAIVEYSFENGCSLGELLVKFFQYISSHAFKESTTSVMLGGAHVLLEETTRRNIQRKALWTYHMLSQTGDIIEVVHAETVHAKDEFVAQIPPHVWRNGVKDRLTQVQESIELETGAEVQVRRLTGVRGPARGQLYAYGTMDSLRRVQSYMERLIRLHSYGSSYRRGRSLFNY
ncbi:uncharacterized protein LOC144881066 [Branchiostoma floridae x Branchiostoma japonicum]